ncbi:MAG: ThiF family adenylyltransferase [Candidatus Cryptobacteroides sp.]
MRNVLESEIFNRATLLMGEDVMESVAGKKVIIFGVGGVGSWCAEGLVRDGIRHLTIVDVDVVSVTNINRQLQATVSTIGEPKVEALRRRLLDINPGAEIVALHQVFNSDTASSFNLDSYDYVIDAIDSLKDKISLILEATASGAVFFSAMGAALKVDPTQIRVAEFWEVRGCPLGSMLRKRMRQRKTLPSKKFLCVYDAEVLPNRGRSENVDSYNRKEIVSDQISKKAAVNGSLAHVTAMFGMTLAGLVIQDIYRKRLSEGV